MDKRTQIQRAETFLKLHHDRKLLVLPNIWDPLGARLLVGLGFPAVATASAAVAYSQAHDDGQQLDFDRVLDTIRRIAACVDVPVTADLEAGYAEEPEEVAANVRRALAAGAVGINLEDTSPSRGTLHSIDYQSARIRAVRAMCDREGVPLVINARTDVFLQEGAGPPDENLAECIVRARAYLEAGADCIYPITLGDRENLEVLRSEIAAPINVLATGSTPPMKTLESIGISRLSLGPGLLRASVTAMRNVAQVLLKDGGYDSFSEDVMSSEEIRSYIQRKN